MVRLLIQAKAQVDTQTKVNLCVLIYAGSPGFPLRHSYHCVNGSLVIEECKIDVAHTQVVTWLSINVYMSKTLLSFSIDVCTATFPEDFSHHLMLCTSYTPCRC